MVARWRHGAYRVVGLEFTYATPSTKLEQLAPQLARLQYLEFIKLPGSTADEAAMWRQQLHENYTVFHCPTHKGGQHSWPARSLFQD